MIMYIYYLWKRFSCTRHVQKQYKTTVTTYYKIRLEKTHTPQQYKYMNTSIHFLTYTQRPACMCVHTCMHTHTHTNKCMCSRLTEVKKGLLLSLLSCPPKGDWLYVIFPQFLRESQRCCFIPLSYLLSCFSFILRWPCVVGRTLNSTTD